jgi:transposase-like protein
MNKQEFKIQMIRNKDSRESLAEMLNISRVTLTRKINETGSEFTRTEIEKIKSYWNLTASEVDCIFFNSTVS